MANESHLEDFVNSHSYDQDDLTWCVQKSKNYPMMFNILSAATPSVWIITLIIGCIFGILFYIMIQFDVEYEKRNDRDLRYTLLFIALPVVTGMNQSFHPKWSILRIFYIIMLIMAVIQWQIYIFFGVKFIKYPVQRKQIKTTIEIIENDFRLIGSTEVLQIISYDERVELFNDLIKMFKIFNST